MTTLSRMADRAIDVALSGGAKMDLVDLTEHWEDGENSLDLHLGMT